MPTSAVRVREARADELAAVGDLTVAGYEADGHLTIADGYDHGYADWLRGAAQRAEGSVLLVAVDDDELLGTVLWCPPGSPVREVATNDLQGEFRTLSVAPTARRRGVARALVEECMRRGRQIGLTEMMLCSLPEMTPAHRLYESFGFSRRPELDWSPKPGVSLWGFTTTIHPID